MGDVVGEALETEQRKKSGFKRQGAGNIGQE